MSDFRSLLDAPVNEIERPKPLPAGNYVWTVGEHKFDKSRQKQTDFVQIELTPVMAQEDVDAQELSAALGDKSLGDFKKKVDFYLTPDAIWRLQEFLIEKLGFEKGKTVSEMLGEMAGRQVVGQLSHQPSAKDENVIYSNLTAFAKYDG
jgi:hypothetical protein